MSHDPPLLSGTVPGLLDPSQPSRLLRTPSSSLFFAAFDPLTARSSGFINLSSLQMDPKGGPKRVNPETAPSPNGKRIVIETDPENGVCSWRFVPRAKTEGELFGEEGTFPRLVGLCGHLIRITQDQWDIYKLDPDYECVVRAPPGLTTIHRMTTQNGALHPGDTSGDPSFLGTPERTSTARGDHAFMPKPNQSSFSTSSNSESPRKGNYKSAGVSRIISSETDSMVVDEDIPIPPADQVNPQDVSNKMKRRRGPDHSGERNISHANKSKAPTPEYADVYPSDLYSGAGGMNDISNNDIPAKKVRTRSPSAVRRELEQKRINREKKRKAHREARFRLRMDRLHRAFWDDSGIPPGFDDAGVYEDVHDLPEASDSSGDDSEDGPPSPSDWTTDDEEEIERLAKIEESRRKLAELEKDRPLWEASARRRQAREMEEEQMRQRVKSMKEEEERQRQQAQAAGRQREEKQEQERRERERDARMREQSRCMFVPARPRVFWTSRHALDRYLATSANFDATKFSVEPQPVTFAAIPWPVLHSSFSVQDIEWDAVESFFGNVEGLLSTSEFKDLVEKSHKRFHPDRWRSRGLLFSVKDDMERDLLEVAGSTVAQAITPLWKQVTGR